MEENRARVLALGQSGFVGLELVEETVVRISPRLKRLQFPEQHIDLMRSQSRNSGEVSVLLVELQLSLAQPEASLPI
jgi:hypothetical protein